MSQHFDEQPYGGDIHDGPHRVESPPDRAARLRDVAGRIRGGTYETREKLSVAVGRAIDRMKLADDLNPDTASDAWQDEQDMKAVDEELLDIAFAEEQRNAAKFLDDVD